MKTFLIIITSLIILLFASNEFYKWYSSNYVNSHESIVLINNHIDENEIDSFFGLEDGIYDSNKHKIVFSLKRKNGYLLDYYINIPYSSKTSTSGYNEFDCKAEYSQIQHFRFYNYEINGFNIIARLIKIDANSIMNLNSKKVIAKKYLKVRYDYGKINVLDLNNNGAIKLCK